MPQPTFFATAICHAVRDQAAFVILNESLDQGVLSVRRLSARPINPYSLTTGTWSLVKITSLADGDTVTVVKADTNGADLNSNVLIQRYGIATETDVLFSRQINPYGIGVGTPATGGSFISGARVDGATVFDGSLLNMTQGITLREGEGISLTTPNQIDMPMNAAWDAQVTIRQGTDTYFISCAVAPLASRASLSIFNGSGSGQVIEVLSFQVTYTGHPAPVGGALLDAPMVRFCRVYGYNGGQTVSPVALDSGYTMPAGLTLAKSVEWSPIDINQNLSSGPQGISAADLGYPGSNEALTRRIGMVRQMATSYYSQMTPGLGTNTAGAFTSEFQASNNLGWDLSLAIPDIQGFRIGPGYGVAIIVCNNAPYTALWVEAEVLYRPSLNFSNPSVGMVS